MGIITPDSIVLNSGISIEGAYHTCKANFSFLGKRENILLYSGSKYVVFVTFYIYLNKESYINGLKPIFSESFEILLNVEEVNSEETIFQLIYDKYAEKNDYENVLNDL